MKRMTVSDNWTLRLMRGNDFVSPEERLPVKIPGTVYGTLMENGKMPEPYVGDNEAKALAVMDNEFVFETGFTLDEDMLDSDSLSLNFYGVDTLAEIFLNDIAIGETNNMHRTWRFDISSVASVNNKLRVNFHSPTAYIAAANKKVYTGGTPDAMEGFPHLRKAHCMFGWDWGMRLPDAGIFRAVEIVAHNKADILQVKFYQEFIKTGRGIHGYIIPEVRLHINTEVGVYEEGEPVSVGDLESLRKAGLKIVSEVESPDGVIYPMEEKRRGRIIDDEGVTGVQQVVRIADPKLWWPNGYGEQPLYIARVRLVDGASGEVLDVVEKKVGLRILTVNQDPVNDAEKLKTVQGQKPDSKPGKNFAFKVNGLQIFAMGANYIPEDNIMSRITPERSRKLLTEARDANYNMIRIWGGGYYPDDWFYDMCDELGLIVWQDFMFACASYELDEEFEATVLAEITDNVRRIRHHACLGLWCGNNEVETQTIDGAWKPSMKQRGDYIKIFEYLIPKLLLREDPNTCYWPSSPSSGGNFDDPWAENIGDTHYWGVWHANEPFTEFRKHHFRFLSEFGFQSFPCLRTVKSFASERDMNVNSRVMEQHQRNTAANGKLMAYLSQNYLFPDSFEMMIYATELLQADAIRYAVEHFRRLRGVSMGTLVWQLNDISPVASWSSIDYFGVRKALYYAERRMFAPVLLSCEEHGEQDQKPWVNSQATAVKYSARLHVTNETDNVVGGTVRWALRGADSSTIDAGVEKVQVLPYDGVWVKEISCEGINPLTAHLQYKLEVHGEEVSSGISLFCAPKHYRFEDPKLRLTREGDELIITSEAYARSVCVMDGDAPAVLSDNFFDMEAGEKRVRLEAEPEGELRIISVGDIGGYEKE